MNSCLLAVAAGWLAVAQAQDLPETIREPARKQQTVEQGREAAEESVKNVGGPSEDVTYEQVLANPDDIELNYKYARAQIKKGNLRSAATTLERILMVNPNLPKVRLLYGVVLFRLDNLEDAQRELTLLSSQTMPATLREELNEYLREIRLRRRKTHFSALLGGGFDFDDNKNAAPATGQRLFFDTPITLNANSTRKTDTAETMLGNLGLTHDLGYQAGHLLYLNYNYYRAEQTNLKILNIQNHYAEAGAIGKTPWVDVTGDFEFDHLLLAQTTYLRSRGARLRADGKWSPRWDPFLEGAYTRQVYSRTPVVPTGDDRTGDKYEATAGARYVLTPVMSLLGSYTRVLQGAAADFDAYTRDSFTLTHTWLLGHGQFLLSTGIINIDRYLKPEFAVSAKNRHDNTYRARVTYGVPLGFIAKPLDSLLLSLSYEYYQAISRNIPNYSYSDNKVSSLLTYKWEL